MLQQNVSTDVPSNFQLFLDNEFCIALPLSISSRDVYLLANLCGGYICDWTEI